MDDEGSGRLPPPHCAQESRALVRVMERVVFRITSVQVADSTVSAFGGTLSERRVGLGKRTERDVSIEMGH